MDTQKFTAALRLDMLYRRTILPASWRKRWPTMTTQLRRILAEVIKDIIKDIKTS